MNPTMLVDAVTSVVTSNLNSATKLFADRPSADNFTRATGAMLAYQQWKGLSPDRKLEVSTVLLPLGIGLWGDTIVKTVTGKSVEEILTA